MHSSILVTERPELDIHIPTLYFKRAIKGPKSDKTAIDAGEYIKLSKKLDAHENIEPNDATTTKENIAGTKVRWTR
jgi:hypothetical protein